MVQDNILVQSAKMWLTFENFLEENNCIYSSMYLYIYLPTFLVNLQNLE